MIQAKTKEHTKTKLK